MYSLQCWLPSLPCLQPMPSISEAPGNGGGSMWGWDDGFAALQEAEQRLQVASPV